MHDQNIDPIALIEWMWDNVIQAEDHRIWISANSKVLIDSTVVLELYKKSKSKCNDCSKCSMRTNPSGDSVGADTLCKRDKK